MLYDCTACTFQDSSELMPYFDDLCFSSLLFYFSSRSTFRAVFCPYEMRFRGQIKVSRLCPVDWSWALFYILDLPPHLAQLGGLAAGRCWVVSRWGAVIASPRVEQPTHYTASTMPGVPPAKLLDCTPPHCTLSQHDDIIAQWANMRTSLHSELLRWHNTGWLWGVMTHWTASTTPGHI